MNIKTTVNIEEEKGIAEYNFDFSGDETARSVCEKVLELEHCPMNAEVSVLYVDDSSIQEINSMARGVDAVTDVLSFPNLPFEEYEGNDKKENRKDSPCWDTLLSQESKADLLDPLTGDLVLGDIVLNLDAVKRQAKEYGHSCKREFAFLIAHSMLHLCGYDHETDEEEQNMIARQEKVLRELGITRDSQ